MGNIGDKTFMKITNKDIYDKIETMQRDNTLQHAQIMEHQLMTNGKVKVNRWISTTAMSLFFTLLVLFFALK